MLCNYKRVNFVCFYLNQTRSFTKILTWNTNNWLGNSRLRVPVLYFCVAHNYTLISVYLNVCSQYKTFSLLSVDSGLYAFTTYASMKIIYVFSKRMQNVRSYAKWKINIIISIYGIRFAYAFHFRMCYKFITSTVYLWVTSNTFSIFIYDFLIYF